MVKLPALKLALFKVTVPSMFASPSLAERMIVPDLSLRTLFAFNVPLFTTEPACI